LASEGGQELTVQFKSFSSPILTLAIAAVVACASDVPPPAIVERAASIETGFFESAGARLSYRLELPARTGKVPAVVFGHGSGRITKDQCRLASGFVARGFATLCYDKRGVGESTGEYSSVGPRNSQQMVDALAEDMAAGVRFLRSHASIDGARVGLAGASQAGWIIPVAAARVNPAFMLILAGPTISVGEEIFYSRIVEQTARPLDDGYKTLPTFRGERGFDPRPVLEALTVPGLWLLGEDDRSIPTPATVAILDELVARGKPFQRVVFPGAGHDLASTPVWDAIDRWLARALPPTLSLTLLGNAAVYITDGRLTLVTDFPYQSGAFGYMTYSQSQAKAFRNVVALITHRHLDHVEIETLKQLSWRVIGPREVTEQLASSAASPVDAASAIDPALRIQAMATPHANVEHSSYVVKWHGRRFYFSGDTEDPASVLNQQGLDIAFVSPWMYQAIRSRSARIDAARVVIYHHTTGERVAGCVAPCEVPAQGAQWSLAGR
jgi:pimeloyl-ACP methyl ester carboxylesterase/L-ascorbate metabolism protein UlaG (beta-lactamase superfamily)